MIIFIPVSIVIHNFDSISQYLKILDLHCIQLLQIHHQESCRRYNVRSP